MTTPAWITRSWFGVVAVALILDVAMLSWPQHPNRKALLFFASIKAAWLIWKLKAL